MGVGLHKGLGFRGLGPFMRRLSSSRSCTRVLWEVRVKSGVSTLRISDFENLAWLLTPTRQH